MKSLEKSVKDLICDCISEAALRHGFDEKEEIRLQGLENVSIRESVLPSGGLLPKGGKKHSQKHAPEGFLMPFIPESIDMNGCRGLAYNRGLFTQCVKKRMDRLTDGKFCMSCQTQADKNASGNPDCGTIDGRLASGLYEFKDPKGRSPVSYLKVLAAKGVSPENVASEAAKLNIVIPEEHLVKTSTRRGRRPLPSGGKKTSITHRVEADNVIDLFAKLSQDLVAEDALEESSSLPKGVDESMGALRLSPMKLTDEEKAAKKAKLEEERALAKQKKKEEREAKIVQEKQEREVKRKLEAEVKKQEREAKREHKKQEGKKKSTKPLAVAPAEESTSHHPATALEPLVVAPAGKPTSLHPVALPSGGEPLAVAVAPVAVAPPEGSGEPRTKVSVTRIQISGKSYLKSSSNILYDPVSKEEVGLWDPESKTIKDLPEDDEQEEEEDYDSDK